MRFRSVLVANRGEIAVRVIAACRALGLWAIAVYSDADRDALHVRRADAAVRLGPPPAPASYLNIDALLDAARASGAEAVHPGYGFLAENADFARACLDAGLVWIGPPPAAMRAMGDKAVARALMERAGVPIVPGYQGAHQDDAVLARAARQVGFPLLVKAAAGGGGRGMRLVTAPDDLPVALASARREAQAAFGNGALLLERYLAPVRHVEVQVFADTHGAVLHLGERECSLQRRHQKVVEEAPSLAVDPDLRAALGAAAVRATQAVGYVGAGTVEFLLDTQRRAYFLEMNTRIQVEHPVTEMITGLDLVALQLRVAAGEPLPITQDDVAWSGHAIECRLVAEDPRRGFAPQTGRLVAFEPPRGPGLRNDVGATVGDTIGVEYDALLAKLIAHGRDRPEAIARMRRALDQYRVAGVTTNLELLRFLLAHPAFAAGQTFTTFIADHWPPPDDAGAPRAALLAAAAHDLTRVGLHHGVGPALDPWAAAGPWRIARAGIPLCYLDGDRDRRLLADRVAADRWRLRLDDEATELGITALDSGALELRQAAGRTVARVEECAGYLLVEVDGRVSVLRRAEPPSVEAAEAGGGSQQAHGRLTAPMPAKVARVLVREGERVKPRQTLVVLESMKIEHLVEAPYAATVERVLCRPGDVVAEGAALVDLAAD